MNRGSVAKDTMARPVQEKVVEQSELSPAEEEALVKIVYVPGVDLPPHPKTPPTAEEVAMTQIADRLEGELKTVLRDGFLAAIAIVLPPKRVQAHDDDDPVTVHPWEIGTIPGLVFFTDTKEEPGRLEELRKAGVVAAVVTTKDSTWAMVNLDRVNPRRPDFVEFMDRVREACDKWGHKGAQESDEHSEREVQKRTPRRKVRP